jgi:LuxR family transcriptional regulator, maltose regulon positive regulatory protein
VITRERARQTSGGAAPTERERRLGLDVVASKLAVPQPRPGSVSRTALVNRLRAAGAFPTVVVAAPAGYGKTTLLAQWAARDARPFAWVTIDERDNDAAVLLRHVAAAFDRIEPLDPRATTALDASSHSIWDAAMPRLTTQMAARGSPFVFALDNADLLESSESVSIVTTLIENMPVASIVVLAGRAVPKVPVAALRVQGPLLEIGAYELALSRRETEILLRAAGVELDEDEIVALLQRTEGWATGVYLATLALRDGTDAAGQRREPAQLAGDDRYLADYFHATCVSHLSPGLRRFLTRTSILEKMCRPLCDAVLESNRAARALRALEQANLFLVPLDHHREWFRYHNLFRDLLRRELDENEPDLVPVLNARAAAWYEANGDRESALVHAHAAGDHDGAARILSSIALEIQSSGRVAMLESWLERFDGDACLRRYPAVAIHGCRIHALRGRPLEAERWLSAAERGAASRRKGVGSVRPFIGVMRSMMCMEGVDRMQVDAETALRRLAPGEDWRPSALLVRGVAVSLVGDAELADSILAEAAEEAGRLSATETRVLAMGERSLLAAARDDHHEAESLAFEATQLVEDADLGSYATSALALAASVRAQLRHGQWDRARRQLSAAERLSSALTYVLPWLAVQVRLELAHAHVTLRDRDAAARLLDGSREIVAIRPKLGMLSADVDALAAEIDAMPKASNGANSGLTAAELRLLPLLSTHLSFREIGQRLYVSRNTIKTQAISVYRKLGVSSRSQAIVRAEELGLVEPEEPQAAALRSAAS